MNKHIKKVLLGIAALTLVLGSSLVSFADDQSESAVTSNEPTSIEVTKVEVTSLEELTANAKSPEVTYMDEKINFDVKPLIKDGKVMIPLAAVLDAMDYKYEWKEEDFSVDIIKGAQFTTIYIDKNEYFKNKMAPRPLSASPIIVDGRTLVPVEFFNEILGMGLSVKDDKIDFLEEEMATHIGYIHEITGDDDNLTITLTKEKGSKEMMDMLIVHAKKGETIFNNQKLEVGELINVISPMFMTMSIPAQTGAIVIY